MIHNVIVNCLSLGSKNLRKVNTKSKIIKVTKHSLNTELIIVYSYIYFVAETCQNQSNCCDDNIFLS